MHDIKNLEDKIEWEGGAGRPVGEDWYNCNRTTIKKNKNKYNKKQTNKKEFGSIKKYYFCPS